MSPIDFYLLLVPMFWLPLQVEQFERAKSPLLLVTAYALLFTLSPRWTDPLLWVGVAWIAVSLISTTRAIWRPYALVGATGSHDGMIQHLAFLVLYLAASQATPSSLSWWIALSTVPVVVYGWAQLAGLDPMPWKRTIPFGEFERPFSGLGHPIQLGVWLAMALPHTLTLIPQPWTLLYAMLAVALAWSTLSRSAWAATFVSVTLYSGLTGYLWWPGIVLVGIGIAYLLARALFTRRVAGLLEVGDRRNLARFALHLTRLHPWVGVGPDNFVAAFHRCGGREWMTEQTIPVRAHWEVLHILATVGFPGLFVASVGAGVATSLAACAILADPVAAAPWVATLGAFAVGVFANFHSISTLSLGVVALAALTVLVS